jgi:DNA-binding GntR family transcriptional regulator
MTAADSEPATLRSTPAIIADVLRAEIIDGSIAPGDRINVRELRRRLEVSHIPIREAVRLLEAEGFVTTRPNVGAVAAGVSLVELEDVYALRRMIEPIVAHRAADLMTDDQVGRIRAVLAELEEIESRIGGIDDDLIVVHRQFHWELLAPGATPLIERTLHSLWRVSERYVRHTRGAALPVADVQHAEMADLCEQRDGAALADLLNEHLHLTVNTLRILYSQGHEF